jgi:RNA polymerase sigma factor (sigma-70 family)
MNAHVMCSPSKKIGKLEAKRDTVGRVPPDELVTTHLPLANALARRFASDAEPLEDLRQVAALGLLKAAGRFDPARGVPFAAYAIPMILGELRHHVRDRAWPVRAPRGAPRSVAVALDDDVDGGDGLGGADERVVVEELIRALRRPEREVVRRYYLADRSQSEVAGELGLTQIQVSRLLRAALATMRARLDPAL